MHNYDFFFYFSENYFKMVQQMQKIIPLKFTRKDSCETNNYNSNGNSHKYSGYYPYSCTSKIESRRYKTSIGLLSFQVENVKSRLFLYIPVVDDSQTSPV